MSKGKKKSGDNTIAQNRRARHEYHIEETIEAGLSLQGWEVKALRAGRVSLSESYVMFRGGEAFLFGAQIQPLMTTSTHYVPEATRNRKLLLSKKQIGSLIGSVQRDGYTCVPLSCYWKGPWVKCSIALVKGKQLHDKRETEKKRDWDREKARISRIRL